MDLHESGEIVTPIDDPSQYEPAWRAIVAGYLYSEGIHTERDLQNLAKTGCVTISELEDDESDGNIIVKKKKQTKGGKSKKEEPKKKTHTKRISPFYENAEYRPIASDKWITAHIKMIDEMADGGNLTGDSKYFRLASKWYAEPDSEAIIKKRLEPLLLTEVGVDIITLDLIGLPSEQPAIEAYEKMYFNCRDENFNLSPSLQLIQRLAMPYGPLKMFCRKWEELDSEGFVIGDGRPIAKDSDVWKAVAGTMGYETLMYLWRWDKKAHGIKDRSLKRMLEISWEVASSRLLSDLYSGEISHEDAARVLSSYTSQTKMMHDVSKGGSGDSNDTTKALMAVLYQTSPHMFAISDDENAVESMNADIQSRISSQLAINKQEIEDKGKAVESEIIDAQISNSINIE